MYKDHIPGCFNCPMCDTKYCGCGKTDHLQFKCQIGLTMAAPKDDMQKSGSGKYNCHFSGLGRIPTALMLGQNIMPGWTKLMCATLMHTLACRVIRMRSQLVMQPMSWQKPTLLWIFQKIPGVNMRQLLLSGWVTLNFHLYMTVLQVILTYNYPVENPMIWLKRGQHMSFNLYMNKKFPYTFNNQMKTVQW